jgi:hypothetical protein
MLKLTERQDFIRRITLASKIPEKNARYLAISLWEKGPRSKRLAEAGCNREFTESERQSSAILDEAVKTIGELLGLQAYRQGDPRGNTIRVVVGAEFADNWDGISTGCG